MRTLLPPLLLLLAACADEPDAFDAWHGAFRIETLERVTGACEGEGEPYEPVRPWLFTAVLDGSPGVASLYWCGGPDDCDPAPFATMDIEEITKRRLTATFGEAGMLGYGLCVATWASIEAEQEGDEVSLVFSSYRTEIEASASEECDEFVQDVIGDACDDVLTFEGSRRP